MRHIITLVISIILLITMLPSVLFGADENMACFDVTLKLPYGNTFTLNDVKFNSNYIFNGDTTKYKHDLAIASAVVTAMAGDSTKIQPFMKNTLKLDNVSVYDYSRKGLEEYRTGYAYGTKNILRNGNECTLILIACSTSSVGDDYNDSVMACLDFMNYEITGAATDFNSTKALTFTKAAELIYDGHDNSSMDIKDVVNNLENSGKDYIVWITGQSRGGSICNYLSKMLVDDFGSDHITSYCISPMNVDKDAVTKNYSKYNCIFNIIHPDDLVTYLPLGTGYGDGWGFGRYGVEVILQCAATANKNLDNAQNSIYLEFVKNNENQGMVYLATDKNYRYEGSYGNGAAIKALLNNMASTFSSPYDFYNKNVTFNEYEFHLFTDPYKTITKKLYPFAVETMNSFYASDSSSYLDLYELAKYTSKYPCDMQAPLNFFLKHFMGYNSFEDFSNTAWVTILANITNLSSLSKVFEIREGGTAHFVDTYLSWLMAANDTTENDNFQKLTYNLDSDNATLSFISFDDNGQFISMENKNVTGKKLTLTADEQAKNIRILQYNSEFIPVANTITLGK